MRTTDKVFFLIIVFNFISITMSLLNSIEQILEYDSLFAKCEQDKEIEINGNKYWCVKIRGSKDR